jgi:hypothetical protein
MRTLWITITDAHVERGELRNCQLCPVACAMRDVLPPGTRIAVYGAKYEINGRSYDSPPEMAQWVMEYDRVGLMPGASVPTVPAMFPFQVEDAVFGESATAA